MAIVGDHSSDDRPQLKGAEIMSAVDAVNLNIKGVSDVQLW